MAAKTAVLTFDGNTMSAVYDDALVPVMEALGWDASTDPPRRASDVEPAAGGGWEASIRAWVPGGEVTLGPFPTRAEALAQEVAHLRGRL